MTFRAWQSDQPTLLPTSPREWLTADHQVTFLLALVVELYLSEILVPAESLLKNPLSIRSPDAEAKSREIPAAPPNCASGDRITGI